MGLAKGRQEGFGYKSSALDLNPNLVCRLQRAICDITGYVVFDGRKAIASASNSHEAWYKAWAKLNRERKEKL